MLSLSRESRRLVEEAARRGLTFHAGLISAASTVAPVSFREFVSRVSPRFRWYAHCERLAAVLQRVADGELRRVMVFLPPRHGKSELVSRLFTAYWLYRFPHQWVGVSSYGADLAYTLSRAARDYFRAAGGVIRDDAEAVKHWETEQGGGFWAAGVGGPITGKGYHLGVIDDPLKNAQDAASLTVNRTQRDWYQSVFTTREEPDPETGQPDGAVVLVQTRWSDADLAGWLLSQEEEPDNDEPERWHVVSLEAIKEATSPPIPPTCTLEFDPRREGEALCPQRRPLDKLYRIRKAVGAYFWQALYQQRPRPREGKLFRREWFTLRAQAAELPEFVRLLRAWDLAATEAKPGTDPDWTAGALVGKTSTGDYYLLDVARIRGTPGTVEAFLRRTAELDKQQWGHVAHRIEQEPGSNSKIAARYLVTQVLPGFDVRCEPSQGSKIERVRVLASQAEAGNVHLLMGAWNSDFIEEAIAFPSAGVHDDQVDAASGAIGRLCQIKTLGAF